MGIKMESCVDIFKVVIGPSSSRTVGPMRAAFNFISQLKLQEILPLTREIEVELYGALSLSRKCHNVDIALYLGLLGNQPDDVDLRQQMDLIKRAEQDGTGAFSFSYRDGRYKAESTTAFWPSLCDDVSCQG
jgi:L-serine dehydratase